jgi:hypothetical protein
MVMSMAVTLVAARDANRLGATALLPRSGIAFRTARRHTSTSPPYRSCVGLLHSVDACHQAPPVT